VLEIMILVLFLRNGGQDIDGERSCPARSVAMVSKVRYWAVDHPEEMRRMGAAARRVYSERYTPAINARQLVGIYEAVLRSERS